MNTRSEKKAHNSFLTMIGKGVAQLFRFTNWTVMALMIVMSSVMLLQILSRYLFNLPLTWPEELCRFLFIWILFLGTAMAFRYKAHLGMDFATTKLPLNLQHIVQRLVEVLILAFLILIICIAPEVLSITQFQRSPVIHVSMNYIYLSFPVASVLMILDLMTRWICPDTIEEN